VFGKKKILCVIPARGGSKRIKNKNIISFKSKPLIYWTIKAAKKTKYIDKIIVSTDSIKIKKEAEKIGIEVPFMRQNATNDRASIHDATLEAISQTEKKFGKYDIVVQLMPNCPLRNYKDCNKAIELFIKNKNKSIISFYKFEWMNPWWAHKWNKNKFENLFNKYVLRRSQDLPDLYCPTGAIWVSNINKLKKYKSFYSPNYMPFIMDLFSAIDIDTVIDLKLANIFSRELNINEK